MWASSVLVWVLRYFSVLLQKKSLILKAEVAIKW